MQYEDCIITKMQYTPKHSYMYYNIIMWIAWNGAVNIDTRFCFRDTEIIIPLCVQSSNKPFNLLHTFARKIYRTLFAFLKIYFTSETRCLEESR